MTQPNYFAEDADLGFERQHRWFGQPKKSHYIPSWYNPHADLDMRVTCDGTDLGFTIRQVLPFRRWAIGPNGATVPQGDFAEMYLKYLSGMSYPETHSIAHEAVPNVKNFVSKKFDGHGQEVDILYNDDGRVEKTEKFTETGEIAPEWMARNREDTDKLAKLATLSELAKEGAISPADFARRTALIMGTEVPVISATEAAPRAHAVKAKGKKATMAISEAERERRRQHGKNLAEINRKRAEERRSGGPLAATLDTIHAEVAETPLVEAVE